MSTVLSPLPGYVGPDRWAERRAAPRPPRMGARHGPGTQDVSVASQSGAVEVDEDFALAHSKDDRFVGFGAGIPLAVDHVLGDEDEVARTALDALGATRAELQPEAALGLEHVCVVAWVDVPAGPGSGFGSGPAGPDMVVGECLATVHTGRLGSGTVERIRSDQGGSVHGAVPSERRSRLSDRGQDVTIAKIGSGSSSRPTAW